MPQKPHQFGSGWTQEILQRLSDARDLGAKRVAKGQRAVAVFDCDHTCILGDIGAAFASHLISNLLLRYDLDEFWDLIPSNEDPTSLRKLADTLTSFDGPPPEQLLRDFTRRFSAIYSHIMQRDGTAAAYAWAVRLHVGLTELDMTTISYQVIREEIARPIHSHGKEDETKLMRGIRPYLDICLTMRTLEEAGFETWIVSATNYWTVSTLAAQFGIPDDRVIGNRVALDGTTLTSQLIDPVLYGKGKLKAIKTWIKERPLLVFGDSQTDYDMLAYSKSASIIIVYDDNEFTKRAQKNKWLLQPFQDLQLLNSFSEIPRTPRFIDPYPPPP